MSTAHLQRLSRGAYLVIGSLLIISALVSALTASDITDVLGWLSDVFDLGFSALYLMLVAVGVVACYRLTQQQPALHLEIAQQAGNGIATLALTFTLLGISLGIATLAEQPLSADTVSSIITELTRQFSSAFMTTVVGLPTAFVLRAWSSIAYRRMVQTEETPL